MYILREILCVCVCVCRRVRVCSLHGKCVLSKSYKPIKIIIGKAENKRKLGQEFKRQNKMQVG